MPITAIYDIGTVNLTKGSDTVTGVGTNWVGAGIREGDMFWSAGLLVRVLALVNNTTVTLAHPWPGDTAAAAKYEVQYTPDVSRVMGQTITLLDTMSEGGIGPLKNLEPTINTFPVYSGANTAVITPISDIGKSIISRETAAQVLGVLGITYQTSRYDKTTNRNLRSGSFGLGATTASHITNINDQTMPTCFATVQPASAQGVFPDITGTTDFVIHMRISGNISLQLYIANEVSTSVFVRRSTGVNVWSAWKKLAFE